MANIHIRQAFPEDFPHIWPTFQSVIQSGDSYTFAPTLNYEEGRQLWFAEDKVVFIASTDIENCLGSYYLKPNQPGLGAHVANAGYMVNPNTRGQGIGRLLGEHSIEQARRLGYQAMQFNAVVSTNEIAVKLWKSLGFEIIGTTPKGYQHTQHGLVDLFIMHRML